MKIGIIGGSGLYNFFQYPYGDKRNGKWKKVKTDYGRPSDKLFFTEYDNKQIIFLPRHGRKHQFPPHRINYRANIDAFKQLGVRIIIAPSAVGSLQPEIKRGEFVICNDFVDRTRKRKDTFFDGPTTVHVSADEAYCEQLRMLAIKTCREKKIRVRPQGTAVIIQGPRYSTPAESKFFTAMGWDVVNMTQYPEVILAREAEICYVNISVVTDYDTGLNANTGQTGLKSVNTKDVLAAFQQNINNLKKAILGMIPKIPQDYHCSQCHRSLERAGM